MLHHLPRFFFFTFEVLKRDEFSKIIVDIELAERFEYLNMMKLHFLSVYHTERRYELFPRVLFINLFEHRKDRPAFHFYLQ